MATAAESADDPEKAEQSEEATTTEAVTVDTMHVEKGSTSTFGVDSFDDAATGQVSLESCGSALSHLVEEGAECGTPVLAATDSLSWTTTAEDSDQPQEAVNPSCSCLDSARFSLSSSADTASGSQADLVADDVPSSQLLCGSKDVVIVSSKHSVVHNAVGVDGVRNLQQDAQDDARGSLDNCDIQQVMISAQEKSDERLNSGALDCEDVRPTVTPVDDAETFHLAPASKQDGPDTCSSSTICTAVGLDLVPSSADDAGKFQETTSTGELLAAAEEAEAEVSDCATSGVSPARIRGGDSRGVSRSSSSVSDSSASTSTGDDEEEEEAMDPRVKIHLETLNQSSADINKLENELTEARRSFAATMQANASTLEQKKAKLKKFIHRTRPFFDLTEQAKEAKAEAERATKQYVTAKSQCNLAKEMISNAEELLRQQGAAKIDDVFQEYINQATEKVMVCEKEKARCAAELAKRNEAYETINKEITRLQKKFSKSIEKSRPYFEERAIWELKLKQNKQNIDDLQQAVRARKVQYQAALNALQDVSTEIHQSRAARRFRKAMLRYPREPGVGAETDSPDSSFSDLQMEKALCGSISSVEEDEPESDEEDETWDDSSNASDGVASPAASRHGSSRRGHSRQSSYDSAQIKLSPLYHQHTHHHHHHPAAVRRSASGSYQDFLPPGPGRAALVRRCASGTASDFPARRAAATAAAAADQLGARGSASGTESDLSSTSSLSSSSTTSSAPASPHRSSPASPVIDGKALKRADVQEQAKTSLECLPPALEAGCETSTPASQPEGAAPRKTMCSGKVLPSRAPTLQTIASGAAIATLAGAKSEEESGRSREEAASPEPCRPAADGSSEEEVAGDAAPCSSSSTMAGELGHQQPLKTLGPAQPRGPAAFLAGLMAVADKSAALHLSACTGEPPVFSASSATVVGGGGESGLRASTTSSAAVSGGDGNPGPHPHSGPRKMDTPPHQRKLKGPMMLNPAELQMQMSTFPF